MNNAWWKHENISKEQKHTMTQVCPYLHPLALKTLTEGECCTWTGKSFQIDTPEYWKELLYNSDLGLGEYNCKWHVDVSILEWISDVKWKVSLNIQVRHHGEFCTFIELFYISPCLGKASILIQRIRMQKRY